MRRGVVSPAGGASHNNSRVKSTALIIYSVCFRHSTIVINLTSRLDCRKSKTQKCGYLDDAILIRRERSVFIFKRNICIPGLQVTAYKLLDQRNTARMQRLNEIKIKLIVKLQFVIVIFVNKT